MKSPFKIFLSLRGSGASGDGHARQPILTNVTWLAAANILVKPFWFVLLLLTARLLGATEFGEFMLAISFVAVTAVLLEGGVDLLTVRKLSNEPDIYSTYFSHTLLWKVSASVVSGLLAIGAALLMKAEWLLLVLTALAAVYSLFNALLVHLRSIFRAFEVMKYEAISVIIEKSTVIVLCGGILFLHLGVRAYMIAYVIGYAVTALTTLVMVLLKFGMPKVDLHLSYLWQGVIKPALPFAVLNIFTIIYFRSGTLLLGAITGRENLVGYFNAGYRLVESFMLFPTVIVAPIYPVLSRSRDDAEHIRQILLKAARALLFVSVSISVPIFVFQKDVTILLFGAQYAPATVSLGILALTMIPISINFGAGTLVAALGRQTKSNVFILAVTVLNLVLNYVLIRSIGVDGAAITTVLTETLLVTCNLFVVRDYVPWKRVMSLFLRAAAPASLAGLLVLTPVGKLAFPFQLGISMATMLAGYFALKLVTLDDLRNLLRVVT